jgi:hypothetical protein
MEAFVFEEDDAWCLEDYLIPVVLKAHCLMRTECSSKCVMIKDSVVI